MCSGMVSKSICGSRRVTLVTNPVTSSARGKYLNVITTNGIYPRSFVTQTYPIRFFSLILLQTSVLDLCSYHSC